MTDTTVSPFVALFRRGDVPRDVRLSAAQGGLTLPAAEQLAILVLLTSDTEPEVAQAAMATLDRVPRPRVGALLAGTSLSTDVVKYLEQRGFERVPDASVDLDAPLIHNGDGPGLGQLEAEFAGALDADAPGHRLLSTLPVVQRVKLAMLGTRDQRAVLVRDPNRLVAVAAVTSPKVTDTEVESFARMTNVSDEVLRIIGTNRHWSKSYSVVSALARNPKTPLTVSMPMVARLNERDLKFITTDRNVPEGLRLAAKKLVVANESRRK